LNFETFHHITSTRLCACWDNNDFFPSIDFHIIFIIKYLELIAEDESSDIVKLNKAAKECLDKSMAAANTEEEDDEADFRQHQLLIRRQKQKKTKSDNPFDSSDDDQATPTSPKLPYHGPSMKTTEELKAGWAGYRRRSLARKPKTK
jgi:hypothetical protein